MAADKRKIDPDVEEIKTPKVKQKRLRIAIFGRPNVGKSTLFNQLTGTRRAIVKDEPGVTRDVHYGLAEWRSVQFDIFDTAGVTAGGEKAWSAEIRRMALESIKKADKVVFVLDGKYGLNPEDRDLAQYLKKVKKPVLTVVNKVDEVENNEVALSEFYELGTENIMACSFEHRYGLEEICDWIIEGQERNLGVEEDDGILRLVVVGKPNAGKSTLVNSILGEKRVVVSPEAGTTIDSVEIPFERGGQEFILVDTAGLRRNAKRTEKVEQLSAIKSEDAVVQADLLILVIDGLEGPAAQDARIVELALEHHRGVIVAVNKVDVAERKFPKFKEQIKAKMENVFHFYKDIPMVYISAKTGRGVDTLFDKIVHVWKQLNLRISTRDINDYFFEVIRGAPSPSWRGNDLKFYYITQTHQRPPSFMAYVNEPKGITNAYKRFIVNKLKEHYDLVGIPIRIYPKKRRHSSEDAGRVKYGHEPDSK